MIDGSAYLTQQALSPAQCDHVGFLSPRLSLQLPALQWPAPRGHVCSEDPGSAGVVVRGERRVPQSASHVHGQRVLVPDGPTAGQPEQLPELALGRRQSPSGPAQRLPPQPPSGGPSRGPARSGQHPARLAAQDQESPEGARDTQRARILRQRRLRYG